MRRGRVGRPVRHDQNYNYRKVPLNYAIHPAFLAWVSGALIPPTALKETADYFNEGEPEGLGALPRPTGSPADQGIGMGLDPKGNVVFEQVGLIPTSI